MVFCGFIGPENVSSEKGIKTKLISHGLNNTKCSGLAWFDYIYLTPGSSYGKINVNTAQPRILASLSGIDHPLAKNIHLGLDSFNKPALKPYKNLTDLLDVKGMTSKKFGSICNLITVRSDQFRINIIAQTLKDVKHAEKSNGNTDYKVTSSSTKSIILDRSKLTSISPGKKEFDVIFDQ